MLILATYTKLDNYILNFITQILSNSKLIIICQEVDKLTISNKNIFH